MWCLFKLISFCSSSKTKISSRGISKGGFRYFFLLNNIHFHNPKGGFQNPWNPPLATPLQWGSMLQLPLLSLLLSIQQIRFYMSGPFLCGISHTLSTPGILFIFLSTRAKRLSRGLYLAGRLGSICKRLSVFERQPLDVWLLLPGVVFWRILRFRGSLRPQVLVFFRHSLPYLFLTRHLLSGG